jgi:hypothetical protein
MKLKITKLKQHVMPTYLHIDSTDVIENDYILKKIYILNRCHIDNNFIFHVTVSIKHDLE